MPCAADINFGNMTTWYQFFGWNRHFKCERHLARARLYTTKLCHYGGTSFSENFIRSQRDHTHTHTHLSSSLFESRGASSIENEYESLLYDAWGCQKYKKEPWDWHLFLVQYATKTYFRNEYRLLSPGFPSTFLISLDIMHQWSTFIFL